MDAPVLDEVATRLLPTHRLTKVTIIAVGLLMILGLKGLEQSTLARLLVAPLVRPPLAVAIALPLGSVVSQLVAATLVARALERRNVSIVPLALASCTACMAINTVFAIATAAVTGMVMARLTLCLAVGPLGGLQVYGFWVLAFRYPSLLDQTRMQALEIERTRQAAELAHLREHLQPHFLRNTLNAIAAFMTEDPAEARGLLAALGDLLSDSIESTSPFRPLGRELDWLRRYAEILEARYRGTLRFTWDEGPMTRDAQVPRLLLQPLVENAVHHGALARTGGGHVVIRTRARAGGGAVVEVEDDGPGFDPTNVSRGRLGLRLVRRRVQMEAKGAFRIESAPACTRAIVELP